MSLIETRREQMFPKLTSAEIDRLRGFGAVRRFTGRSQLMSAGRPSPGMIVLISGAATVARRDKPGHTSPIVDMGAGDFIAEVGDLSGRPSLVDVHAASDVEALIIPTERLRALMIAEAELGERIMRALILRRVALVEIGAGGPVLIGDETSPDIIRLQGFLTRNSYPNQVLDPAEDPDAKSLVERYAPRPGELPWLFALMGQCSRIRAKPSSREPWEWFAPMRRIKRLTSPSSEQVQLALRPRSTRHPKARR